MLTRKYISMFSRCNNCGTCYELFVLILSINRQSRWWFVCNVERPLKDETKTKISLPCVKSLRPHCKQNKLKSAFPVGAWVNITEIFDQRLSRHKFVRSACDVHLHWKQNQKSAPRDSLRLRSRVVGGQWSGILSENEHLLGYLSKPGSDKR